MKFWKFGKIIHCEPATHADIKMAELTPKKRAIAISMVDSGSKQKDVAKFLGVNQSTISRTISKARKGLFTASLKSKKRTGRPRRITTTMSKAMKVIVEKNPSMTSSAIKKKLGCNVSPRTIRNHLQKDLGLRAFKPVQKPLLSEKNIRDRQAFCQKYRDWTSSDWQKVMFSDEAKIVQFSARPQHVRRPVGERFNIKYVTPTVKNPPSVMIWGAITANGRAGLWVMPKGTTITAKVYLDILKDKLPVHMAVTKTTVFQHDGAPVHTAKLVKRWLAEEGITVLDWPGSSPDLNPIENCWTVLKGEVDKTKPTSANDLIAKIKVAWTKNITVKYCADLINSMPRRIRAVIENNGQFTKY